MTRLVAPDAALRTPDAAVRKPTAPAVRFRRVHPGATLADMIAAHGLSARALARKLRVPANRVGAIVNGRRGISADTALRLSRCFGTSATFWMNLQQAYDLFVAEETSGSSIEAEVEVVDA